VGSAYKTLVQYVRVAARAADSPIVYGLLNCAKDSQSIAKLFSAEMTAYY
jgi:hypothetical protein